MQGLYLSHLYLRKRWQIYKSGSLTTYFCEIIALFTDNLSHSTLFLIQRSLEKISGDSVVSAENYLASVLNYLAIQMIKFN